MDPDQKKRATQEKYKRAQILGLGVMIPGLIFGCIFAASAIGFYLDKWLDTAPWITLAGVGIGVAAAVREVSKILKKINKT